MPGSKPLEFVLEDRVTELAEEAGYRVRKLTFLGVRGAPDRIFGRNGETIAIEFKRAGERPTKQQLLRAEELRSAFGWKVGWADTLEDACSILKIKPE